MYRAIFLCIFQGAMDQQRFWEWNKNGLHDVQEQLALGKNPIQIDFIGRKKYRNIKPYFSFLGTDAVNSLKAYMKMRPDAGDAIFYNYMGNPVTPNAVYQYWMRHLVKCGYINRDHNEGRRKRYGFNPHELRDIFRSQWEKSPAKPSAAEHCLGHAGDPLGYEKASSDPKWVREQYVLAMPWLNIISNPINEGMQLEISKIRTQNYELVNKISEQQRKIESILSWIRYNPNVVELPEIATNPDLDTSDFKGLWNIEKNDPSGRVSQ